MTIYSFVILSNNLFCKFLKNDKKVCFYCDFIHKTQQKHNKINIFSIFHNKNSQKIVILKQFDFLLN